MPDEGSILDGLPITRRRLLTGAVLAGVSISEIVEALDADGESGVLYGGIAALNQAYNPAGNLYVGPDSTKSSVNAKSGRVFLATDTQVDYYGDSGSWVKMGIGSSSTPAGPSYFESLSTEQVGINRDGTPTLRFDTVDGLEGSDGGTRGKEVILEQDPNSDAAGSQRLLLRGHTSGENVILGRTYEHGDGTISSHEMLKPVTGGDTALEAEIDGKKLRLQESGSTSFLYGAVQIETSDGQAPPNDTKVARLSVSGGQDPAVGVWRNVSRVQLEEDDAPFVVGTAGSTTNWQGEFEYDSSIDHVALDSKNTAKLVLRAQGSDHIQLRGTQARMQATLDMNGQNLIGVKEIAGATAADLGSQQIAIDPTNDAIVFKDSGGNAVRLTGTAI